MTAARIDGADVSHYQDGPFDLPAAGHAGARFLAHKATEGTSYRDPNYQPRRREAKAAGLPFGAYHFARPASSSGLAQAQFFLSVAGPKVGDLRPMLDLEDHAGLGIEQLTDWAIAFVTEVHRVTGAWPFVYTPFDLAKRFLQVTDCPLWVARYSNPMWAPRVPAPWRTFTVWQFSDGVYGLPNQLAGIGRCDLNTLHTSKSAMLLANFILGGQPSPVTPDRPVTPPVLRTRVAKVQITFARQRVIDVKQLDLAVKLGRRGAVKSARDHIDAAMFALAKACGHEQGTRVARVLAQYAHDRTIDVHLLDQAVAAGRHGQVQITRDEIVAAITHTLPKN